MQKLLNELEKKVVEYAENKNLLVNADAIKVLAREEETKFKKIIDELANENETIISLKSVEKKIVKTKIEVVEETVEVRKTRFKPLAKEVESNYRILEEYNITNQSSSEGTIDDFIKMFQNKFEALSEMLKKRPNFSPKPLKRLKAIPNKNDVDLIGMVSRKWVTKNGHNAIEIEDLDNTCIAVGLKDDRRITTLMEHVLLDDVIGIKSTKISNEMVIIKDILWPDLPIREEKKVNKKVAIAGLSDLHVGSKLFLEKSFNKFLEWINGKTSSKKELEKVEKIKYIIISGDNVDGIGIYPAQFNELNIKDINKQYEELSNYLMQIPEYIEIFIIPGQHDAVRWADPQPAIPKKFVPELYKLKNFHFLSSPGWIEIEGLKILMYHGASMHDLYSSVSFFNLTEPQKAMVELLKKRDLMPTYGLKQPYAPEKKDFMLIREIPDLFFTGDMHHNGYDHYHGTTVLNSGTWQARTSYQIKLGHVPTPCIIPVIDLSTRKINETVFYRTDAESRG